MSERRSSGSTGWFVGIIVALALLAIAYLVFSANANKPAKTALLGTHSEEAVLAG